MIYKFMILNNDYELDFLENNFLENRPGIDPLNYRVGQIDDKVLVWNPNTNIIMENYYDDRLDIEWFDVNNVVNVIPPNKYLINRDGIVIKSKNNYTMKLRGNEHYPRYKLNIKTINRRSIEKSICVHRLLGLLFKPNLDPNKNNIIDHIDHNTYNYSLTNLRWVDTNENVKNKIKTKYKGDNLYFLYLNKERTQIVTQLTEEELYASKYNKNRVFNSIKFGTRYSGYYWSRVNLRLKEYLDKINVSSIDETLWKETRYSGVYAHPLGLIKSDRIECSVGGNEKANRYRVKSFSVNKKRYFVLVHVLIAETFLNDNKPIQDGFEVDHISTDKLDNRVENLRIVTHKDNMNNQLTVSKFSKRVQQLSTGKIYNSIKEAAKDLNVSEKYIYREIKSGQFIIL